MGDLSVGQFEPYRGNATASIVIAPAIGVEAQQYFAFARFLASCEYRVLTFDYMGISALGSDKETLARIDLRSWADNDLAEVLQYAASLGGPVDFVGHSIGGQLLGFCSCNYIVRRAMFVAAQNGYWRFWSLRLKPWMFCLWHLVPMIVYIFGCLPLSRIGMGCDLPPEAAYEWAQWGRNAGWPDRDGRSSSDYFSEFSGKLLSLSFEDDELYAPSNAVNSLLSFYCAAQIDAWLVQSRTLGRRVGHGGFFSEKSRQDLWLIASEYFCLGHVKTVPNSLTSSKIANTGGHYVT